MCLRFNHLVDLHASKHQLLESILRPLPHRSLVPFAYFIYSEHISQYTSISTLTGYPLYDGPQPPARIPQRPKGQGTSLNHHRRSQTTPSRGLPHAVRLTAARLSTFRPLRNANGACNHNSSISQAALPHGGYGLDSFSYYLGCQGSTRSTSIPAM